MLWYYEKDNTQNGPVSEEELLALYQRGIIQAHNLVWREGMADWAPLADSFPNLKRGTRGLHDELSQTARRTGNRGTGGQTPNAQLRLMGREVLAGNWGIAVLVFFLYVFLLQIGVIIPILGQIAQWVITGPLTLGLMAYFVGLHRREPVEVGTLFSGFSRFVEGLGIYFVTTIMITLSALAAAIPGGIIIFLAYSNNTVPEESALFAAGILIAIFSALFASFYMYLRYALVYYIANDYPELGILGAIKRSTEMMVGRKVKFFMLGLSFIGWHFLGMLAFGIGLLWSMTYMWSAFAAFYEDLGEEV